MLGIHEQVLLKIVVLVILYLKNHENSLELNALIFMYTYKLLTSSGSGQKQTIPLYIWH